MRELLTPLVGADAVNAFRSTAVTPELLEWADVIIGFQPSHIKAGSERAPGKPVVSMARWAGVSRIADPNFDSSGRLHAVAVQQIQQALPLIYRDVTEAEVA